MTDATDRGGKLEQATALLPNAAIAAAVVSAVVATEYAFRHYVLFWMPTLGTLRDLARALREPRRRCRYWP